MLQINQLEETVQRLHIRLQGALRALYVLHSNGNDQDALVALSRIEQLNQRITELNELLDEYKNGTDRDLTTVVPIIAEDVVIDDPDQDDIEIESRGTMWAVFAAIAIVALVTMFGDWMFQSKTNVAQTTAESVVLEEIVVTAARLAEPVVVKTAEVTTITYIVQPGDTLWSIAAAQLGDGSSWATIYGQNVDTIDNPDLIFPGQSLTISSVSTGVSSP